MTPTARTCCCSRRHTSRSSAPPLTLVIDKQGRIATIINGVVVYSQLLKAVRAANAEPAAA